MFTTVLYRCMSRGKVVVHGISFGDNNNSPSRSFQNGCALVKGARTGAPGKEHVPVSFSSKQERDSK
ncbi:hypothetical protein RHMOL_Rhmol03G0055900 [Rhododendron molle]|uniref:Uncharacterized protein n=1 Tax=Rhododendron molle TaxID=49168 RepID=A0ACC0PC46_RHOML|nr:hypothetical protein RHMOL_Rhmol03G0055900 [Rhododendron molle]